MSISRVDFEVEKILVDGEIVSAGRKYGLEAISYKLFPIQGSCPYDDWSTDEQLESMVLKNWNEFITYTGCVSKYWALGTFQEIRNAQIKMRLYEKFIRDSNGECNDINFMADVLATVGDDKIKQEYLKRMREATSEDDKYLAKSVEQHMEIVGKDGNHQHTSKDVEWLAQDVEMAKVIVTLSDLDVMMEYYSELREVSARRMVIEGIQQRFPEYSRRLTAEELNEVLAKIEEHVCQVKNEISEERLGLEGEVLEKIQKLRELKQELKDLKHRDRE